MKKRCFVLFILFMFFSEFSIASMNNMQLPFSAGETLVVTRGYDTSSHKDYGIDWMDDRYALDFVGNGCSSWDDPILTVASGIVVEARKVDDNGYGKHVIINHGNGDNQSVLGEEYRSRYAHLNSVNVDIGDYVEQGQIIGTMGNTGSVSGSSCPDHPGLHLHFALYYNKNAEIPEPMSGYLDFLAGNLYTSANHYCSLSDCRVGKYNIDDFDVNDWYRDADGWRFYGGSINSGFIPYTKPFSLTYYHLGGSQTFGHPISDVKKLHPQDTIVYGCPARDAVWVQDFTAVSFSNINEASLTSIMVLNPYAWNNRMDYWGVTYPLHGQMLNYWKDNFCDLGPPVSNEFFYAGDEIAVQWFEPYPSTYVAVGYWTQTGQFHTSEEISHMAFDPRFRDEHLYENIGCPEGVCTGTGGGIIYEQPQSNFTTNTTNGEAPLTVYFTNTSTSPNGEIVSYEWDFKDGSMSDLENPSHIFSEAGEYNVSLTITDEVGESDIFTSQINVTACSTCGPCDNIGTISSMTGDLFQANTYNIASQRDLKLTKLNGVNRLAIVWESSSQDGSNDTVVTKLIDLDALAISGEEIVNTFTEDAQSKPKILATVDGYLIAWESRYQDGDSTGVFAQFFDNNAKKIGSEFQVNTYVNSYQRDISLAGNPNYDNIIIVWESNDQDGDDEGIYAQLYNQNTKEKVGGEFRVNTIVVSDQEAPSVVINPNNGNFFIVWSSLINNDERNIIFQEIDQNGNKVGGEIIVASNSDYKFDPQIIITDSNEIVVAWRARQISMDYEPYAVFVQVLNINTKAKIGNPLQANTCGDIKVLDYSLRAISGGDDYIIVYESQDTYSGQNDIYYQKFDVDGGSYGNIVKVSNVVGDQKMPGITFLDESRYIIYFHSDYEENEESSNNVYLQGFGIDFFNIMLRPTITEIEYN